MRIAVIGTGNVGSALGGSFVRAGHEVTFAALDRDATVEVAERFAAASAATPAEAASQADVVVLAVPFGVAETIAATVAVAAPNAVIIHATNPLRPDYSGLATADGPSGAERIAAAAPGARVVKAFNTVFAGLQADPSADGGLVDVLVAADDPDAKSTVAGLVRSIGARPIDAGPLAEASALEAMAWLNIQLQMRAGGDWRSTFVLVGAPDAAVLQGSVEPVLAA